MAVMHIKCSKCGGATGLGVETPAEWMEGTTLCRKCSPGGGLDVRDHYILGSGFIHTEGGPSIVFGRLPDGAMGLVLRK